MYIFRKQNIRLRTEVKQFKRVYGWKYCKMRRHTELFYSNFSGWNHCISIKFRDAGLPISLRELLNRPWILNGSQSLVSLHFTWSCSIPLIHIYYNQFCYVIMPKRYSLANLQKDKPLSLVVGFPQNALLVCPWFAFIPVVDKRDASARRARSVMSGD